MGFAGGTRIMEEIIKTSLSTMADVNKRAIFYLGEINFLDWEDWNCKVECLILDNRPDAPKDVAYDMAYRAWKRTHFPNEFYTIPLDGTDEKECTKKTCSGCKESCYWKDIPEIEGEWEYVGIEEDANLDKKFSCNSCYKEEKRYVGLYKRTATNLTYQKFRCSSCGKETYFLGVF